jgi:hypothetical protein
MHKMPRARVNVFFMEKQNLAIRLLTRLPNIYESTRTKKGFKPILSSIPHALKRGQFMIASAMT